VSDAVTVKTIKLEDHFADVLAVASGKGLADALMAGGYVVEGHAKINASRGRPGLNVITGNLVNSINTTLEKSTDTMAEVDVGPTAVYGRIHELGGIAGHGSHIPARPYLRPAVDEHEDDIATAVGDALKAAIEGATR
jgi:phage gpG-like protein